MNNLDVSKPICYLHVGLHKTGTTSIQGFLSENFEEIKNLKFFYPTFYLTESEKLKTKLISAHHRLIRSFIDKEKFLTLEEAQTSLLKYKEICQSDNLNLILSSENISGFFKQNLIYKDKTFVSILKENLNDFKIIPIISFRNHLTYYLSFYGERIRKTYGEGSVCTSFAEFLLNRIKDSPNIYTDIFKQLLSLSDNNNVLINVFEESLKNGIVESFLSDINCSYNKNIVNKNLRPSLSVIGIELKRHISKRITSQKQNILISKFLLSEKYKKLERNFVMEKLKVKFNNKVEFIIFLQDQGSISFKTIDILNSDLDKLKKITDININYYDYSKEYSYQSDIFTNDLKLFFEEIYAKNLLSLLVN